MKQREINEGRNGTIWVPDSIADWDAPSHWERERLASMQEHLRQGMTLVDVGTEHGWLSAIYGQYVGPENVVLCEPGREFWTNIRKTWISNQFPAPLACWPGFIGSESSAEGLVVEHAWPAWSDLLGPETPAMPYRSLAVPNEEDIPTITIDDLADTLGIQVNAITCDVEGAELTVMQGALGVLTLHRPLVWLSVHPDLMARDFGIDDVQELFDHMEACGYKRHYLGTDHEQHHLFIPAERA